MKSAELTLKLFRMAAAAIGLVTLAWVAPLARAEGFCPPGHYPIGGGTGGWVGCAPMDGGVGQAESPASVDKFNITAPGLSNYDAKQWSGFLGDLAAGTIASEREALRPDQRPIYDELIKGFWAFGTSRKEAPVPMCTATFWYRRIFLGGGSNGGFMYMDWGGSEAGTMLAFFDQQIPTVRQVGRVRVQLVQDGQTQEVEAFHTTYPGSRSMGMIMMRVPSLQALLSAIVDQGSIELKMDERELNQSKVLITRLRERGRPPTGIYHAVTGRDFREGLSARDALTTCLREQGRLPKSGR
jgi:hypothetical protein